MVGVVWGGCSWGGEADEASRRSAEEEPDAGALGEVGTCRGEVARQEAAGRAVVEWIPMAADLSAGIDVVFTATGVEDLGERDIYEGEDGVGVDLPRLVRFTGTSTLAGLADDPVEALVSPFDVTDATTEIGAGASLLVWMRPAIEGRRFASLAAFEPSGDVVFLGDCKPAWTPAFARFVEANGGGRSASEVLTAILVDPEGQEAVTFRASAEASTPAGPARG